MKKTKHTLLKYWCAALCGVGMLVAASSGFAKMNLPGPGQVTPFPPSLIDPSTPVYVSFVLKAQNLNQLQQQVLNGMPGGFLTPQQFASKYGQSSANIKLLQAYLQGYGITTTVLNGNLDVIAQGTAGQFNNALHVQLYSYNFPASPPDSRHPHGQPGGKVQYPKQPPLLPPNLNSFVLAINGLFAYTPSASSAIRTPGPAHAAAVPRSAAENTVFTGNLLPSDFAQRYNLNPLYGNGTRGTGKTIGIIALAALDASLPASQGGLGLPGFQYAPQDFWAYLNSSPAYKGPTINTNNNRISIVNVDGGAGAPYFGGSEETDLDVEQAGALAPNAAIIVYQGEVGPSFIDAFFQAASDNKADAVSTSFFLYSDPLLQYLLQLGFNPTNTVAAYDEAFLQLAAQGQSTFIASGDSGAYFGYGDFGSTNLSVATQSASPWVTSTGGTTLKGTIPLPQLFPGAIPPLTNVNIPAERAWGWDWFWPFYASFIDPNTGSAYTDEADFAFANVMGSTGGYSIFESMPSYQQGVPGTSIFSAVEYLTPTGYSTEYFGTPFGINLPYAWNFNPSPRVTFGIGNGRVQPDVSADADPYTGYQLYAPIFASVGEPVLQSGWGGTSFVDPQLNGATVLMVSKSGHRIGLWNPIIYSAATQWNSPFTPLNTVGTNNDNLYYSGLPGTVYNPASGLGTPNLYQLYGVFSNSPQCQH